MGRAKWSRRRDLNARPSDYKWILGGTQGYTARLSAFCLLGDPAFSHAESLHDRHTTGHTLARAGKTHSAKGHGIRLGLAVCKSVDGRPGPQAVDCARTVSGKGGDHRKLAHRGTEIATPISFTGVSGLPVESRGTRDILPTTS